MKSSKPIIAVLAVVSFFCVGLIQAQTKQWKDRAEYDMYEAATKAQDPAKAIQLLDQWKAKYPTTDYNEERLVLYLNSFQKLNDAKNMMQTAKDILAINPKNFQALLAATSLTVFLNDQSAPALEYGQKAAKGFLEALNEVFVAEKKPANITDEAFNREKATYQSLGHRTLGWIAMQQKELEQAERELTEAIKLNGNDAEAAYWLGSVLISQKDPDKVPNALFFVARAACYNGQGAIPEQNRKAIQQYLNKTYTSYHGSDEPGLNELCNTARAQAFPPEGFNILSQAEIEHQKEQEFARENPQLAFWMKLKDALVAPDGQNYFEGGMKGALVPPENIGTLTGTLIRHEPAKNPKTLVLGIVDPNIPEVTITLEEPFVGAAPAGTKIQFRGVPSSFTQQPFMVSFDAENANVTGWPAPAPKKASSKKAAKK